jgi:hypothetical protein
MRGYFAVLFDDAGPVQSGHGSYAEPGGAALEAREWAESEGLPLTEEAAKLVATMNRSSTAPRASGRVYTGIGSRETPPEMLALMTRIARRLSALGYTLRSGAASGADSAFEAGAGEREVYLPWEGFNGRSAAEAGVFVTSQLPAADAAEAMASEHHGGWAKLSQGARRLHSRNTMQVLGQDLATPSAFVICWGRNYKLVDDRVADVAGGTGLAVRLAFARRVPVFHLGIDSHRERIERWLERSEATNAASPV